MIDWITKLSSSTGDEPDSGVVDQDLLRELRKELKECEALYRDGANLCACTCPEKIGRDPEKFPKRMRALHRGLLVKVFVELAECDRQWHRAEREVALTLLQHVWGVDVDKDNLTQVLRTVADYAEMLTWESLLEPFIGMPPLADQVAGLYSHVLRIANLIAKADGNVLPSEARCLKSIQTAMENVLDRRDDGAKQPQANGARVGQEVGELVKTQRAGEPEDDTHEQPRALAEKSALDEFFAATGSDTTNVLRISVPTTVEAGAGDQKSRAGALAEAMEELGQLIGIEVVKKDIRQLVNFLKIQEERERHGLPRTQVSLHTVFRGNPGTGKTTVARILARVFGGLGILEKGHTVETDRSGLVAQYLGQTGPKVNRRVDEALGGVLFIDEAYSLIAERGEDSFGTEAVQVLVKRMEDDRKRLVVVLAGYPHPLERMLRANPGLSSRFQRTFDFPDYTADELVEIFERMCKSNHYVFLEAAREKLRAGFQLLIDRRDEHFGNGRLVRNSFELAIRRMANRIVEITPLTRELLTELLPEDIHLEGASACR